MRGTGSKVATCQALRKGLNLLGYVGLVCGIEHIMCLERSKRGRANGIVQRQENSQRVSCAVETSGTRVASEAHQINKVALEELGAIASSLCRLAMAKPWCWGKPVGSQAQTCAWAQKGKKRGIVLPCCSIEEACLDI